MCGIVGLVTSKSLHAAPQLYDTLTVIQHRGQDAAGIATSNPAGNLCIRKDNGLVRDVFQDRSIWPISSATLALAIVATLPQVVARTAKPNLFMSTRPMASCSRTTET